MEVTGSKAMKINVYTPNDKYSGGLLFVQKGSTADKKFYLDNQYDLLCEFKDFKGIIEDDIKKDNYDIADYSWE